ncbi:MAG: hypothetical protein AAFV53_32030 [Myxococcota bacterium]
MRILTIASVVVLAGCTEDASSEAALIPVFDVDPTLHASPMDEDAIDALVAGPGHTITIHADGAFLYDLGSETPIAVSLDENPVAAAVVGDDVLFATPSALMSVPDSAQMTALAGAVPGPVDALDANGPALWLSSGGQLFHYADEQLIEVLFDEASVPGAFVSGAPTPQGTVTWIAHDSALFAMDDNLEIVDGISVNDAPVDALAVDERGHVWSLADGALSVWDGSDVLDVALSDVQRVYASPLGGPVWVQTADGGFVGDRNGFAPAVGVDGIWAGVDGAGGLQVVRADGLVQVSLAPAVRILGLPDPLRQPTPITFATALPAAVDEITVQIGDIEQVLTSPPWGLEIDPSAFASGPLSVTATTRWNNDAQATDTRSVEVDAVADAITWEDFVQPLSETRCLSCHGAGTTDPFDTRESWVSGFDIILDEVESGDMPLVGDPLNNEALDRLRQWKDAGFP